MRGVPTMPAATALLVAAFAVLALCAAPASAQPGFGLKDISVSFAEAGGAPATTAGSHPFSFTTAFNVNTASGPGGELPIDAAKDIEIDLPPGLVGDSSAVKTCSAAVFLASADSHHPTCPDETVVGLTTVKVGTSEPGLLSAPVYNMTPPRGAVLKFGFIALAVPVTFEAGLRPTPPYNGYVSVAAIPQALNFYGASTTVWGYPSDPSHDALRGNCLDASGESRGLCPVSPTERPFLTLPRSCTGPLTTTFAASSWQAPSTWLTQNTESDAMGDCAALAFGPTIDARPTSDRVSSPSGLAFDLDVSDEGLTSPSGRARSDIAASTVTLPRGVTINPSQAEGLAVCSEAQFAREGPETPFGTGCPAASKIGTVEAESPLLEGAILQGSLFVAEPYANRAEDSMIAIYLVVKDPEKGVMVALAGKVEPDPGTGQLITTFDDIPQLPVSHFRLRFREGGRSSLITPPGCGEFQTTASFIPWSDPASSTPASSRFRISRGVDGGSCPSGPAPFDPHISAGTISNQAGSYSPFALQITRGDGEQDLTKVSSVLPPGVVGRITGVSYCPEAGIGRAAQRTGPHGGLEERDDPSCPPGSLIGHTVAGVGVGSQLTYVTGSLYLAGPYRGDPLSIVSITPALAGPFDAGTVVVRFALTLDPHSAEVEVDGSASDPIPHILKGIPLSVRDLRAYTDRPRFTLNATSCEEERAKATLWGGGTVIAPAPDSPVERSDRYQAAGCRALAFRPRIALRLKGGVHRGDFPALRVVVRPRAHNANLARLALRFPRSEFIEQGHFRTICTRVQFSAAAGFGVACPEGSKYGHARVWTPLLDKPLVGPIFLRSSNHKLPDVILALHGPPSLPIHFEVATRIDSVHGGLRAIASGLPDAPVSRAVVNMRGGQKGLFVNSIGLCGAKRRAHVGLRGQNGAGKALKPQLRAVKCKKTHRRRDRHRGR